MFLSFLLTKNSLGLSAVGLSIGLYTYTIEIDAETTRYIYQSVVALQSIGSSISGIGDMLFSSEIKLPPTGLIDVPSISIPEIKLSLLKPWILIKHYFIDPSNLMFHSRPRLSNIDCIISALLQKEHPIFILLGILIAVFFKLLSSLFPFLLKFKVFIAVLHISSNSFLINPLYISISYSVIIELVRYIKLPCQTHFNSGMIIPSVDFVSYSFKGLTSFKDSWSTRFSNFKGSFSKEFIQFNNLLDRGLMSGTTHFNSDNSSKMVSTWFKDSISKKLTSFNDSWSTRFSNFKGSFSKEFIQFNNLLDRGLMSGSNNLRVYVSNYFNLQGYIHHRVFVFASRYLNLTELTPDIVQGLTRYLDYMNELDQLIIHLTRLVNEHNITNLITPVTSNGTMTVTELINLNVTLSDINQRYFSLTGQIRTLLLGLEGQLANHRVLLNELLNQRLSEVSYLYSPSSINRVLPSNETSVPSSDVTAEQRDPSRVRLSNQVMLDWLVNARDRALLNGRPIRAALLDLNDVGLNFNPTRNISPELRSVIYTLRLLASRFQSEHIYPSVFAHRRMGQTKVQALIDYYEECVRNLG